MKSRWKVNDDKAQFLYNDPEYANYRQRWGALHASHTAARCYHQSFDTLCSPIGVEGSQANEPLAERV
jgi:hypothetical protein